MKKKPTPFIPIDSLKTQRVDVYINDLQEHLHKLRRKYDTILIECCDIQKKIHEVSTETMAKQAEIGKIISKFEELRLSSSSRNTALKETLVQKAGDVRRLREKFETMIQENFERLIVQANNSIQNMDKLKSKLNSSEPLDIVNDDQDPDLWSTLESFYSCTSEDNPESLCLDDDDEVGEAAD